MNSDAPTQQFPTQQFPTGTGAIPPGTLRFPSGAGQAPPAGPAGPVDPTPRPTGGRTAIRVLGALVALGIVGGSAVSTSWGMWRSPGAQVQQLPAGVEALTITGDVADVEVRAAGRNEPARVELDALGAASAARLDVSPNQDGSSADVDFICERRFAFIGGSSACDVTVVVTVPSTTALDITADVGRTTVTGWEGPVDVTTDVGEIRVLDSRSDTVRLSASLGEVVMTSQVAPTELEVLTEVGQFDVTLPDDGTAYAVRRSVGMGDLEIQVPQDSSSQHRLDLTVNLGDGRVVTE